MLLEIQAASLGGARIHYVILSPPNLHHRKKCAVGCLRQAIAYTAWTKHFEGMQSNQPFPFNPSIVSGTLVFSQWGVVSSGLWAIYSWFLLIYLLCPVASSRLKQYQTHRPRTARRHEPFFLTLGQRYHHQMRQFEVPRYCQI